MEPKILSTSDHIWVMPYRKSAKSSLEDPNMQELLRRYLPDKFTIKRTENGRLYATSPSGNCPYFSIAHSHHLCVIAFSNYPIGIDIEFIKSRSFIDRISARFFSKTEPHNELIDFYRSWTAREAYIKATNKTFLIFKQIKITDGNDWLIGLNNNFDYHVIFNQWDHKYVIAVCRPAHQNLAVSYFTWPPGFF